MAVLNASKDMQACEHGKHVSTPTRIYSLKQLNQRRTLWPEGNTMHTDASSVNTWYWLEVAITSVIHGVLSFLRLLVSSCVAMGPAHEQWQTGMNKGRIQTCEPL